MCFVLQAQRSRLGSQPVLEGAASVPRRCTAASTGKLGGRLGRGRGGGGRGRSTNRRCVKVDLAGGKSTFRPPSRTLIEPLQRAGVQNWTSSFPNSTRIFGKTMRDAVSNKEWWKGRREVCLEGGGGSGAPAEPREPRSPRECGWARAANVRRVSLRCSCGRGTVHVSSSGAGTAWGFCLFAW